MQIPESKLQMFRGKVIGIGDVKVLESVNFDYDVPNMAFIVIKQKNGDGYVSSCIHLQMDGYGETIDHARRDMVNNIAYFLYKNFNREEYKECGWENILDLFEMNEDNCVYWNAYHAFKIRLAEQGDYHRVVENFATPLKKGDTMIDIYTGMSYYYQLDQI